MIISLKTVVMVRYTYLDLVAFLGGNTYLASVAIPKVALLLAIF
jgi:hypothetical protein